IRHTPEAGEVRLEMIADEGVVRVRVCDTGCGIEPEQLPGIFDRFKPARTERERAGLGLSIVKRIIDLHAQQVAVSSERNVGTTVEFTLARVAPRSIPAMAAAG